jgi:hypothetical protein
MDTTTPRKKVLSTPKDWDEWFLTICDYAIDQKVWDLSQLAKQLNYAYIRSSRCFVLHMRCDGKKFSKDTMP